MLQFDSFSWDPSALVPKIALKHVVSRTKSMLPFSFFWVRGGLLFCFLFLTGLQHSCYFLPELAREVLQGGLGDDGKKKKFICNTKKSSSYEKHRGS